MKHAEKAALVAARMAQFHNAEIVGDKSPTLFKTIRKWLGKVPPSYPDPDKDARFKKQFSIEQGKRGKGEERGWVREERGSERRERERKGERRREGGRRSKDRT